MLERQGSEPFAVRAGRTVTVQDFVDEVRTVAGRLPEARCLMNTCQDRYRFMVAFFATVLAGRTNLLAPSRTGEAYQRLQQAYPGARAVADEDAEPGVPAPGPTVAIAPDAMAAIAFTSGSTGSPQPNPKTWLALRAASRMHGQRLGLDAPAALVTTVPPWHMYGLEWTVLVATVAPLTVICDETFYPDDVRRALAAHDGPRVLVSTPVHLRALLRSAADFPPVHTVVCATAPLSADLARQVEARFGGRLLEIYGCTEAGTLAHRLPTRDPAWQLFPAFELEVSDERGVVRADFLDAPVELADRLARREDGGFDLLGRWGDLVKVAGKRASLADLNQRLLAVPGVTDAVLFQPDAQGEGRLCAFVVAPGLSAADVRRRLAAAVDTAFLPRPVRMVDSLPRSDTGKLTLSALAALLSSAGREAP